MMSMTLFFLMRMLKINFLKFAPMFIKEVCRIGAKIATYIFCRKMVFYNYGRYNRFVCYLEKHDSIFISVFARQTSSIY